MEIQTPHFNGWTIALSGIAVLGLALSFLIFSGVSNFTVGRKWLALTVFSFALILGSYVLFWTGYYKQFPYLANIWPALILLIGPSLYFYLNTVFKEPVSKKTIAGHFLIPALSVLFILPASIYYSGPPEGFIADLQKIGAAPVLMIAHLVFYSLKINRFSTNDWQTDDNIQTWTRIIVGGMWVYTGAFFSYYLLVRCSFFNPEWDYCISLVMSLGILGIAYMGLLQKRVFECEPLDRFLPIKKYQSSTLTPGAGASILKRMEQLLEEEHVFKENELRLDDLAAYLNTGRHQVSQVINEQFGINFFELINRYRIAYVKKMLSDPAYNQLTIMQIAFEAGFNNKASFNRYFKNATGLTPSAYRLKLEFQ